MEAEPTSEQIRDYMKSERRERAMEGMRAKVEKGFIVAQPKLGYKTERTKDGTVAILDPETAPLVARAFHEVAVNGLSLRQVTRLMQEIDLKGRRDKPVSLSTMQRVLTDRTYAGFEAGWPAAVSKTVFGTVQRKLALRRR